MRLKALRIVEVGPLTVTILSGHEPSEMLILAPDCEIRDEISPSTTDEYHCCIFERSVFLSLHFKKKTYLFSKTLDDFALLADDAADFLQHTHRGQIIASDESRVDGVQRERKHTHQRGRRRTF